jgi:hypothetical protein
MNTVMEIDNCNVDQFESLLRRFNACGKGATHGSSVQIKD